MGPARATGDDAHALTQALTHAEFLATGAHALWLGLGRRPQSRALASAGADPARQSDALGRYLMQFVGRALFKRAWAIRPKHRNKLARLLLQGGLHAKGVKINIGLLEFSPLNGRYWGSGLFGGSAALQQHGVRHPLSKPDVLARRLRLRKARRQVMLNPDLPIRLPASCPERENDSEYLLLNALDQYAQTAYERRGTTLAGQAELFTERVPCASCVQVIQLFLARHPRVDLTILYALDGDAAAHAALAQVLADAGRAHGSRHLLLKIGLRHPPTLTR